MNKTRLARINAVFSKLEELKAEIETIRDEEQEYYDNMPESIQSGEKGEKANDAIGYLDATITNIETVTDELGNLDGVEVS